MAKVESEIGVHVDVPSVKIDGMSIAVAGGTAQSRLGGIGRIVRRMEFDHALVRTLMARGVYVLGMGGVPEADATQLLAERLTERGLHLRDYRVKRFSERGFEVHRPFAAHRVLLVGEAAGIDPIFGEGIAQAIAYGKLAGDYLATRLGERELRFDDWTRHVALSALGLDLTSRGVLVSKFYGGLRPVVERVLLAMPDMMHLTMSVFAGRALTLGTLARLSRKGVRQFVGF